MTKPWNDTENAPILLTATTEDVGMRLDQFLAQATELTRSATIKLI